jgi:hypothetical protein
MIEKSYVNVTSCYSERGLAAFVFIPLCSAKWLVQGYASPHSFLIRPCTTATPSALRTSAHWASLPFASHAPFILTARPLHPCCTCYGRASLHKHSTSAACLCLSGPWGAWWTRPAALLRRAPLAGHHALPRRAQVEPTALSVEK